MADLRGFPRPVWILLFGTFLNKIGTFVMPFLALYLRRLGYTPADVGLAVAAYGSGTLVAAVWGGHLADTIGRRKTIMLSMFLSAIAITILSQVHSFSIIVWLSALAGLSGELYRPTSSAYSPISFFPVNEPLFSQRIARPLTRVGQGSVENRRIGGEAGPKSHPARSSGVIKHEVSLFTQ